MVILEMTIHEGRTYNHPFESYSNFKQGVEIKASLSENENPEREGKLLQERASLLLDEIKNKTLLSLCSCAVEVAVTVKKTTNCNKPTQGKLGETPTRLGRPSPVKSQW